MTVDVSSQLAGMCDLVGEAMRLATTALLTPDRALADEVVDGDGMVDLARVRCEQQAYGLELPAILMSVRAAERLERMGDLAVHVAEAVLRSDPRPVVPDVLLPRFAEMGRIAVDLAARTALAIRRADADLARSVGETDGEMDDLHRTLFTVIRFGEWDYGVATAVDVSMVSRYYERFADHAVIVADQVVSAVAGERGPLDMIAPRRPGLSLVEDGARCTGGAHVSRRMVDGGGR